MGQRLDDLVLHSTSKHQLEVIIGSDTQGILLSGEVGVGLRTIALNLASMIRSDKAMVQQIIPDGKGTIGVDTIHDLYHSLRTKHADAIVIIIDDADKMTLDAQNALLKLLEEPPQYVSFILTSHAPEVLLPTITSRVQEVIIKKVASPQTEGMLPRAIDKTKKAQILFLGNGYAAETFRLMNDETYFAGQVERMGKVRQFLTGTTFDKMSFVAASSLNREEADRFLRMLGRLILFSIDKQPKEGYLNAAESIDNALEALRQNGNIRLQLTKLSLELKRM